MALRRAAAGPWREVTVEQYRRWTALSTFFGALIVAAGLWFLFHAAIVLGLFLVVFGMALGLWTALLRIDGTPAALHKGSERREVWTPRVLHFYTRQGCSLCHEARLRLDLDLAGKAITVVEHDVDADPVLQRQYGDRVPVAVFEGGEVFALQYDDAAVRSL